ncbi:MAG: hypothetical protein HUJ69_09185, partial [Lachnospiraceae bacterium]|nr:hypothetical protein [Lachnospiraceae bacterium]
MIPSEVRTFTYETGEIQRIQVVRPERWSDLEFFHPQPDTGTFDEFCHIYRTYLVPACPWLFGQMILFHLPEDLNITIPEPPATYGTLLHPMSRAAAALKTHVRIRRGRPVFLHDADHAVRTFWNELESRHLLEVVSGQLPSTIIIPVGPQTGFLSKSEPDAPMKCNANFFIMDRFDCASIYDVQGTPFGLQVKNGFVESPPLFNREALIVRNRTDKNCLNTVGGTAASSGSQNPSISPESSCSLASSYSHFSPSSINSSGSQPSSCSLASSYSHFSPSSINS